MSEEMIQVALRTSPTIGKLAEAMAKAQAVMAPAAKDSTNPHFKNKYASLASCHEAIKPMHENGLAVFQPPVLHGPDGVCVQTLVIHTSGEWLLGELYMPAAKKDPQGFGSALTYARRYCLCSTVGLSTDDDDAQAAAAPKAEPAKPPPATGGPDVEALLSLLGQASNTTELAAAEAKVGVVVGKLDPKDRDRLRAARDNKVRELDKAS